MREPRPFWPPPPGLVLRCGAVASVTLCLLSYGLYQTLDGYWIPELDVDSEGSVAAWLSSVALFSCALILLGIARRKDTDRGPPWAAMAAVFGYLSLDEMSSLHEKVSDPLREALSSSGPLLHPWVVPAALLCVVGTIAFRRLLRTLHRETSGLFTAGGLLYLGGAIGFEVLSGTIAGPPGVPDSRYAAVATTEELLEMLGITVFLAALARYDLTSPPAAVQSPVPGRPRLGIPEDRTHPRRPKRHRKWRLEA